MEVTRVSMVSGKERTRNLAITPDQLAAYNRGMLAQEAFPNLSEDDREFFLTGITPDEWNEAFPDEEDDDFDDDEPAF